MKVAFVKYQGTGNDFIMIDNRKLQLQLDKATISRWCDRKFGIGADGLILIQDHPTLDFEMVYYNSDGSQSMCGNGSRCAVNFAHSLGIIGNKTTFMSTDGEHHAHLHDGVVKLSLADVDKVEVGGGYLFANTGSPHHLIFAKGIDEMDIVSAGRKVRYSEHYAPKGTNVNFVEVLDDTTIKVRTYERGVEDETLSCGTGVTAAALGASTFGLQSPVQIITKGGKLSVSFERSTNGFSKIYLTGPAEAVFAGQINHNE